MLGPNPLLNEENAATLKFCMKCKFCEKIK